MAGNEDARVNLKYSDEGVCRLFLCGLCPHELFLATKMDMGPCLKVHSLRLRKEYEKAKHDGLVNYNEELEYVLLKLVAECHLYISRTLGFFTTDRVGAANAIPVTKVTRTPEVMELAKRIKNKLKEADEFDLEGKINLKIRALEEAEELRTERAYKESMLFFDVFSKLRASTEDHAEQGAVNEALNKKPIMDSPEHTNSDDGLMNRELMHTCDICGALLDINYSDRRLADHFRQKFHLACMQIREKLDEIQEEIRSQEKKKKRKRGYISLRPDTFCPSKWNYKVDAAFSSSEMNQVYVFMGNEYAVVDYVDHKVLTSEVLKDSLFICCGFASIRHSIFPEWGISGAFRCKDTNEVFLFCGYDCVKINFAPHTPGGDYVIEGPIHIFYMFPCLTGIEFKAVEAAFEFGVEGQAYLFNRNQYALISYGVDRKLIATGLITEAFPCLRNTIFETGIGAAFTSHRTSNCTNEVYLFRGHYYALLSFTPGSTDGRIIDGVKETLPNWPSLRQILPRRSIGLDICPCVEEVGICDEDDTIGYLRCGLT